MDAFLAGGEHDCTGLPRRAALTQALAALLPVPLRAGQPHTPARLRLTAQPGPEILRDVTGIPPVDRDVPPAG
jgi:hypothetical protein